MDLSYSTNICLFSSNSLSMSCLREAPQSYCRNVLAGLPCQVVRPVQIPAKHHPELPSYLAKADSFDKIKGQIRNTSIPNYSPCKKGLLKTASDGAKKFKDVKHLMQGPAHGWHRMNMNSLLFLFLVIAPHHLFFLLVLVKNVIAVCTGHFSFLAHDSKCPEKALKMKNTTIPKTQRSHECHIFLV